MRILGGEGWVWGVSDAEGEHLGRIGGIVVEALAALPAVHSCQNHALEERRSHDAHIGALRELDFSVFACRYHVDGTEQPSLGQGIAGAQLHYLLAVPRSFLP